MFDSDANRPITYGTKMVLKSKVVVIPVRDNKFDLEYLDKDNQVVSYRQGLSYRVVMDLSNLEKWTRNV